MVVSAQQCLTSARLTSYDKYDRVVSEKQSEQAVKGVPRLNQNTTNENQHNQKSSKG